MVQDWPLLPLLMYVFAIGLMLAVFAHCKQIHIFNLADKFTDYSFHRERHRLVDVC
jgi:hypothetical protein